MKRRSKTQIDPDCVVTLSASDEKAFRFRRNEHGVVMEGPWEPAPLDANVKSPAATIAVLQPSRIVCRTIELPDAAPDKLEIALQLQAETKQMGSVDPWRTASAVLNIRGEAGTRTGVVIDWPTNDEGPSLSRDLPPDGEPLFTGDSAILAAVLDGYVSGPLVTVTEDRTAFSFAVKTPKGLSVRSTRIDPAQWPEAATIAVVESALGGGMNVEQAETLVLLLDEAISAAGAGGFGCTQNDRDTLASHVSGLDDVDAWREHGLKALAALVWFSPVNQLVSLRAQPLGERPGHVGEWINHLGDPRSLVRAAVICLVMLALGPPLFAGSRLLLLHFKIGDVESKERSLRALEKRMDLYSDLSRRAWPIGKLLGDLANVTPMGIEWEDLTLSQDRNVSLRGTAKPQDGQSGTEVILVLEKQIRDCKVFDKVTQRWDPPDSKGMVKFTLNASVIKATLRPNFKEVQDFGLKTLAERRYPKTTAPTDNIPEKNIDKPNETSLGNATTNIATQSTSIPTDIPSVDPLQDLQQPSAGTDGVVPKTENRNPLKPVVASQSSPTNSANSTTSTLGAPAVESESTDSQDADSRTPKSKRGGRSTATAGNDVPKRSERTPDSANVSTPIPPPLSDTEINAMTKAEAQDAMGRISIARNSAEVDDETKARLKDEFNRLKNYVRGKQ